MMVNIDAFLSGLEVVFAPQTFFVVTWRQAYLGITIACGLLVIVIIWAAYLRSESIGVPAIVAIIGTLWIITMLRTVFGREDDFDTYLANLEILFFLYGSLITLFITGLSVGSAWRSYPGFVVFFVVGLILGIVLPIAELPSSWCKVLAGVMLVVDAGIAGVVLANLLFALNPENLELVMGPFRVLMVLIVAIGLISALVPFEEIQKAIVDGGVYSLNDPPITGWLFLQQNGLVSWLFPGGALIGILTNVGARFGRV